MTEPRNLRKMNRSTEDKWSGGHASRRTIPEMVRPSRDRLNKLSRELVDALVRSRAVVFLKDQEVILQAVSQALTDELRREEEREAGARRRIAAMRTAPRPTRASGKRLFRKFVEEEYLREGLDT